MKNKIITLLLLLCFVCSGCSFVSPQRDNSRFYTLGDHSVPVTESIGTGVNGKLTVINLLLDEIPSYADYPYIVIKSEGDELIFSENSRWAEPFGDACVRILLEKVSQAIGDRAIIISSMHTIGNTLMCDYRLSVDFDDVIYNEKEKGIVVKCIWSFFDYGQRRQICLYKYAKVTPVDVKILGDIVNATKIALSELANDMAEKICQLGIFYQQK